MTCLNTSIDNVSGTRLRFPGSCSAGRTGSDRRRASCRSYPVVYGAVAASIGGLHQSDRPDTCAQVRADDRSPCTAFMPIGRSVRRLPAGWPLRGPLWGGRPSHAAEAFPHAAASGTLDLVSRPVSGEPARPPLPGFRLTVGLESTASGAGSLQHGKVAAITVMTHDAAAQMPAGYTLCSLHMRVPVGTARSPCARDPRVSP